MAEDSAPAPPPATLVRPLASTDCAPAAELHSEVLGAEFITRMGTRFLETYYRAWADADGALALVAASPEGRIDGVLLGALDPPAHTASMVRRHGWRLGARVLAATAGDPRLARDVLVTRAARYAEGLLRVARHPPRQATPRSGTAHGVPPEQGGTGEITHLLVAPAAQGRGIGRSLVATAEQAAVAAGLGELVLVTPEDEWGARRFYERTGWSAAGDVTSRSGEHFVRYRRCLQPRPPSRPGSP